MLHLTIPLACALINKKMWKWLWCLWVQGLINISKQSPLVAVTKYDCRKKKGLDVMYLPIYTKYNVR